MSASRGGGGGGGLPPENNPNLRTSPSLAKCNVNAAVVAPFAPDANGEAASPESATNSNHSENAPNVGVGSRLLSPPVSSRPFRFPNSASKSSLSTSALFLNANSDYRRHQQSRNRQRSGASDDGVGNEDAKATVRQRNAAMLFNELMADVWFLVGADRQETAERIPAHSYVLATGSSVFYAMFFGNFSKHADIDVPDVESKAFRILLKYLYTDEIDLNFDTVLATLYAAKKYLVTHLIRACVEFLEAALTARNVCLLLSQRNLFEEEDLMERCWEVVDAQAEMALRSDGFIDLDVETVKLIFERDTLNVRSDAFVFEAALRWADAECARRQLELTTENRRSILEPVFDSIRLSTVPVEEFANGPAQSGLLDSREVSEIFLYFFARNKPSLRFECRARTGLPLRRCHRFQSCAHALNQWRHRGRCDSIQFSTDRRIFVAGFGLYGSSSGSAEFKVCIELKKAGQLLAAVNTKFFCDGSSNIFPVYFVEPVQVEPDISYTASAVLEGCELCYFGQDGQSEVAVDNVTFQFQCSTESTNGTVVQGGQIPEILYFCGN